LEGHAHRIYRRDSGGCHAQTEKHHQGLAEFTDRGEHCVQKSTNVTVGIASFPFRNKRGRNCCGRAEALESDLWVVRGDSRQPKLSLTMGIVRPRYEYTKTRQLIFWRLDFGATHQLARRTWAHEGGNTRYSPS
jgi:hypothetical protein